MIKTISSFIFKDVGWKLLALFSAIVLYFIVMNYVNPVLKRPYAAPIQYKGEDILAERGFIILNKPPAQVTLNIQAKSTDISNLYNTASPPVTASVDLSKIDDSFDNQLGQTISLPIDTSQSYVYSIVGKEPVSAPIVIDKIKSAPWPVKLIITGSAKDGYQSMPAIYQGTVNATAPGTVLGTIGSVEADVDIAGADKDVAVDAAQLRVLDSGGKDITASVTLSLEAIRVRVPVYPIKTIPVIARISGNPAPGYWVSDKTTTPKTVDIVGPADILEGIGQLELAPIQLNGATVDISKNFDITEYLSGAKLSVRNGGLTAVNVTVKIDKESSKHISLSLQDNVSIIRDDSNLETQLPRDPITVTIQGPANAINGINSANLHGELDLSGLRQGIHDVTLHLDLPSNVSVVNAPIKVRVVIADVPATATILPNASEGADGLMTGDNGGMVNAYASNGGLTAENGTVTSTGADASEPPETNDNTSPAPDTEGNTSSGIASEPGDTSVTTTVNNP